MNPRPLRALACSATILLFTLPALGEDSLPRRGMFGVQLAPVTEENYKTLGLDKVTGILIGGVFPDTPAAAAGLKEGDVVLRVNETEITKFDDFIAKAQTTRGGDEVTLAIRRGAEALELKFKLASRAQEKHADFDIVYDHVTIGDLRLRTIITKPRAAGKYPAVLYIQNLGPMSIDWFAPQMQNPVRTVLYELTQRGIVTMRVELAGIGDSEGSSARNAGFQCHVPHFAFAAKKLGYYDFVDAERIFVFGERMGGIAAPLVAADAKLKGIAVWGAPGRPIIESQLDASRQHQKLEAYSEDRIKETLASFEKIMKLVLLEGKSPGEVRDANPAYAELMTQVSPDGESFMGRHVSFYRELAKLDLAAAWKAVACNVLVLHGAGDWTSCAADARAIADAVNAAHSGRAKLAELPGIDGMFSKVQDMEESYLAGSPGEFNPIIVDELAAWIGVGKERPGTE